MKIEVIREDLRTAAETCLKAAGKSNVGILGQLMLKTDGGNIVVTGYNLDIGITATVPAGVAKKGAVCVDGKLLSGFLAKCSGARAEIYTTEDGKATFKCDKSKITTSTADADEYPELPEFKAENGVSLKTSELNELLTRTSYCAAVTSTRPVLQGVFLDVQKGMITAAACDGYRFSEYQTECTCTESFKTIIPRSCTDILPSLINGNEVQIQISKNMIKFKTDSTVVYSRTLQGDYIDYKKIMQTESTAKFTVNGSEIRKAAARLSLVLKDNIHPAVMRIENDKVILSYRDGMCDFTDEIEATLNGETTELGINVRFLSEAFKRADEAEVSVNGERGAIIITEKKHRQAIMPMRLNRGL